MASQTQDHGNLHIVMFPFMAQGHMIPMVDIAKLLVSRGATVTIITTPNNALRHKQSLSRAKLNLIEIDLPYEEVGLPEGCENLDSLPSLELSLKFLRALYVLRVPALRLLEEISPPPSCLIADMCLPWTNDVARRLGVPRISFHGMSCFALLSMGNLQATKAHENVTSDSEYFVVPGLPDRIKVTRGQIPEILRAGKDELAEAIAEAEEASYGVIINSFEALETKYAKAFKKAREGKVWFVGPASLLHKDTQTRPRGATIPPRAGTSA